MGRRGLSCGLEAVCGVEGAGVRTARRLRISGEPGGLEEVEPEDNNQSQNPQSRVTKAVVGKSPPFKSFAAT